jgi:hypothetical protein
MEGDCHMRDFSRLAAAAGLCAGAFFVSAPAHAVTFATYTQIGTKTTVDWRHTGALNGQIFSTLPGKAAANPTPVTFNFADTSKYLDNLPALLSLHGSEVGNPATDSVDQGGIGGSFTFTYEGPTTTFMGRTYTHDVTNLLTGVYTLAHITGTGSSGSFHDSVAIGTLTYTSDIITSLSLAGNQDFSFALVSINPDLSFSPGRSLKTFKSAASGAFSANLVPEPATWAIMLIGLGGIGAALRRRRGLLPA